jgi:hypothetical protein
MVARANMQPVQYWQRCFAAICRKACRRKLCRKTGSIPAPLLRAHGKKEEGNSWLTKPAQQQQRSGPRPARQQLAPPAAPPLATIALPAEPKLLPALLLPGEIARREIARPEIVPMVEIAPLVARVAVAPVVPVVGDLAAPVDRVVVAPVVPVAGSSSAARRFASSASRRSIRSTTVTCVCSRALSPNAARSCLAA